ncbi:RNA polymerase sigma factor [Candidatus Parcubacteria bacterium]|nr:MAG: RNA polymerase sigma factor [Candidatus Parcubacteria bacterium]
MNTSSIKLKLLLARVQKGDPEAYADIYELYIDRIYRFIFFKVSNHEEAEDLAAEVFLKTWQYLIQPESKVNNLNALLYQTARNCVIDFYRQNNKRELLPGDETLSRIEDKRQQKLLIEIEAGIELEKIEKHISKLKDEYREILILKYLEELSNDEIAKVLEKSAGAVRVLSHRALKILKDIINASEEI